MRTPSTERIDQLALVWLLVPRKDSPLSKFREQLDDVANGEYDPRRLADECAARLRERGMIRQERFVLTEAGRNEALKLLGADGIPPKEKKPLEWAKKMLLLRSLGIDPTPGAVSTAGQGDVLAARILARRHKLDRNIASGSEVVARLARRALGLEELPSLSFHDAFPAVFLDARSPAPLDDDGNETHSAPPPSAVQLKLADCKLPDFASQVTDAARSVVSGRWHGAVFISHVWKTLNARGDVGITFKDFKRRLVEAHQKELVELSRADLVEAMPAEEVSESETVHAGSGARFHFIRIEQLAS